MVVNCMPLSFYLSLSLNQSFITCLISLTCCLSLSFRFLFLLVLFHTSLPNFSFLTFVLHYDKAVIRDEELEDSPGALHVKLKQQISGRHLQGVEIEVEKKIRRMTIE